MRDSLAYIQIFVPHLECEILKAIPDESVWWTKAILIDFLKVRAIEFCNCILLLESNHGYLSHQPWCYSEIYFSIIYFYFSISYRGLKTEKRSVSRGLSCSVLPALAWSLPICSFFPPGNCKLLGGNKYCIVKPLNKKPSGRVQK